MRELLIDAIRNRRRLHVRRCGDEITVEPHAYGQDFCGKVVLLCYRLGSAAVAEGWMLLSLDATTSIREAGEQFAGARPGYRRGHGDLPAPLAAL